MKKTVLFITALLPQVLFANANQAALVNLGLTNVEIKPSPVKGLNTVFSDEGLFYLSEDGKFLFHGELLAVTDEGVEPVKEHILLDKLNAIQDSMIIYPAKQEKFVVTVFTDITCAYCNKFHAQIQEYNDLGITVRYLAFPRAGIESQTAKQMEAIWQAKDRNHAFNQAEKGELPKNLETPNIVAKHFVLGQQYGLQGTPSIVTNTGMVLGGYLPPKDLLKALQQDQ